MIYISEQQLVNITQILLDNNNNNVYITAMNMRAQGPNAQCIVYNDLSSALQLMVFSHEYTQTIWCILFIKFSMDQESPGFELGTFRFQT